MQVEQIQQLHQNTTHAPDLSGTDTAGGDQHKGREKGGPGSWDCNPKGAAEAIPPPRLTAAADWW